MGNRAFRRKLKLVLFLLLWVAVSIFITPEDSTETHNKMLQQGKSAQKQTETKTYIDSNGVKR